MFETGRMFSQFLTCVYNEMYFDIVLVCFKVYSFEIASTMLTYDMSDELTKLLQKLSKLKTVVITKPPVVNKIPDLKSIIYLRLQGFPAEFNDWQSLKTIKGIKTLDVSIGDKTREAGKIHVEGTNAELSVLPDGQTVASLAKVLYYVPTDIIGLRVTITPPESNHGLLCVTANKATISNIVAETASAATTIFKNFPKNIHDKVG